MSQSKKIVPATVTFVDIAGLVKGASEGEGLGNQFLTNIRETDAIVQVVRCFEDERCHPRRRKSRSHLRHRSHQPRAHPLRSSNGRKHRQKTRKTAQSQKRTTSAFSTRSKKRSPTSTKTFLSAHFQGTPEEKAHIAGYPFPHRQKSALRCQRLRKRRFLPWKMLSSKKSAIMPLKKATLSSPSAPNSKKNSPNSRLKKRQEFLKIARP